MLVDDYRTTLEARKYADSTVKVYTEWLLTYLRSVGEATGSEVWKAVGGKPASIKTLLCRWTKEGVVLKNGNRPAKYSVPI